MNEYNSRYLELGFYVDGAYKQFHNGRYATSDKREIEVLSSLSDVVCVCEEKPKAKSEEKVESKPQPKAQPKKPSAK